MSIINTNQIESQSKKEIIRKALIEKEFYKYTVRFGSTIVNIMDEEYSEIKDFLIKYGDLYHDFDANYNHIDEIEYPSYRCSSIFIETLAEYYEEFKNERTKFIQEKSANEYINYLNKITNDLK